MKIPILMILFYALASCKSAPVANNGSGKHKTNTSKNDLEVLDLKGRVKSVIITDYTYHDGKKALKSRGLKTLDAGQHLLDIQYFDEHDSLDRVWHYKYGPDSTLKEIDVCNNVDFLIFKMMFHYDAGNISECVAYKADGSLMYKDDYEYNENGNCVKITTRNYDPDRSSTSIYKYDKITNKPIEVDKYESESVPTFTINYKYNATGKNTETTFFSHGKREAIYTSKFENFDKEDNWLKKSTSDGSNVSIEERKIEYYQ